MNKCVFLVGSSKELVKKVKDELEVDGIIHEIAPEIFKKRGSLAALIKTAKTVSVCVNKSEVPVSEINIAIAGRLSFHIADKTAIGNTIVHSSRFFTTTANLN